MLKQSKGFGSPADKRGLVMVSYSNGIAVPGRGLSFPVLFFSSLLHFLVFFTGPDYGTDDASNYEINWGVKKQLP